MPAAEDARGLRGRTLGRQVIIALCLAGAVALFAYSAESFFRTNRVHESLALTPLDDARELAARRSDVFGTYATGSANGDRVITVRADGGVEFSEIGADPQTSRTRDTWELARREKKFALSTKTFGVVNIVNIDTLEYYGDTYRRTP